MNPEDIQNVICKLCGHPTPEDELMFSDWDYAMCGQCYTGNNEMNSAEFSKDLNYGKKQ